MPVTDTHQGYDKAVEKAGMVEDCYMGSCAIKEAGDKYLPKLSGQKQEEYDAYKERGLFLPVVKPTAVAFLGAIMRKDPVYEVPESMEYLIEDVNGDNTDIELMATHAIKHLLLHGRIGYLVEHDGERAYFYSYPIESIRNWSEDFVVLQQTYTMRDPKDAFVDIEMDEYLVLRMVDGVYTQELWREVNGKMDLYDTATPLKRGEPLDYIPFVVANTSELSWYYTNPGLYELSVMNVDNYRLATDLRHGLHYTALPTMFLFGDLEGDDGQKAQISVGAGRANHIPDPSGRAELLEFNGAGLGSISKAISESVVAMAGIGAKMLATNEGGVKAAETARIEASAETASLSTIASTVEQIIGRLFEYAMDWSGVEADFTFELNKDFIDAGMEPQEITALLQAWQGGGISLDTFLYNLQAGEILPKDVDIEEEKERIEEEGGSGDVDLDDETPAMPFIPFGGDPTLTSNPEE